MNITADKFLTKEQLRERLNLPSTRMIDELVRAVTDAVELHFRSPTPGA